MSIKEVMKRLGIIKVEVDPTTGLNVLVSRDGKRYDSREVAKAGNDLAAYNEAKSLRTNAAFRKVAENTPDVALATAEGFQKGASLVDAFDPMEGPEQDYPVASTVGRMLGAVPQVVSGVGAVGKGIQAAKGAQTALRAGKLSEGAQAVSRAIGNVVKRNADDVAEGVKNPSIRRRFEDILDGTGYKKLSKTEMKKRAAEANRLNKGPTVKSKEQADRIVREMQRINKKENPVDLTPKNSIKDPRVLEDGSLKGGVTRVLEDGSIKGPPKTAWQKLMEFY